MRNLFAFICVSLAPAAFILWALQDRLLSAGILNTKDLRGVAGAEHGSISEYLLNVWCWDGALLVLWVLAVPGFFVSLWLLELRSPAPAGLDR